MIDRQYLRKGAKDKLTNSDWTNAKIILEQNLNLVLMFQRGEVNLSRNYHIVLGSDENLKCLENVGVICGYDIKHDMIR